MHTDPDGKSTVTFIFGGKTTTTQNTSSTCHLLGHYETIGDSMLLDGIAKYAQVLFFFLRLATELAVIKLYCKSPDGGFG